MILDLVMNHTSSLHPWFEESRQSRTGPFADFYLWRDPSGWDRDGRPQPPNNWLSWFGGSAWAWEPLREQFYLHTFLPEQPDVNWRCAALREEMWSMVTGWLDRGRRRVPARRLQRVPQGGRDAVEPGDRGGRARSPGTPRSTATTRTSPSCTSSWPSSEASSTSRPGTATVGELFTSGIEAAVGYWAPRHLVFDWVLIETPWTAAAFRDVDRRPGGRLVRSLARDRAVQPRSLATRLALSRDARSRRSGDGRRRGQGRRDDRADPAWDAVPLLRGGDRRPGHHGPPRPGPGSRGRPDGGLVEP